MRDIDRTKEQLIDELMEMRQQIAGLEALETNLKQSEELFRMLFYSCQSASTLSRMDTSDLLVTSLCELQTTVKMN